jgi:ribosomal protein S18 acetylase RimI-like enzyme
MMPADIPIPAREVSEPDLVELLYGMYRALRERGESPSGDWIEEVAGELHRGERLGWVVGEASSLALGFCSITDVGAFGHIHAGPGASDPALGARLLERLLDAIASKASTFVTGFSGYTIDEENELIRRVDRPGGRRIERWGLLRPIGETDAKNVVPPGTTLRRLPVREVPITALAQLDQRAYQGTVDALLTGPELRHHQRILEELLDHRLGRFLDEASMALVESATGALVGLVATAELSSRTAVILDVAVDPTVRRNGYGRFLLEWTLRALRALGYEEVRLWVTAENIPARRLYEALGFQHQHHATLYRWERPSVQPQPG